MESDIGGRTTCTLPGGKQIDQTLSEAKDRVARTRQGARLRL